MPCTSPPWPGILLTLVLPDIVFMVLFSIFLQTGYSQLSGSVNLQNQGTARFWMSNSPIKALTLWMLATFRIRIPPKIKSLHTFNIKRRNAFLIAIPVLLLPKSSIKKHVCSNSRSRSFSGSPPSNCPDSQFLYAPCDHIVTVDRNIVRNIKLRDLLSKDPKYREPVSYSRHQNLGIIMEACEEYARRRAKNEDVEAATLSEWIKSIAVVLKRRIRRLKYYVNTRHESIFSNPDVIREHSRFNENFVIVPADKASNNYTFVCKRLYVSIYIVELEFNSFPWNATYNSRIFLHQKWWTTTNRSSLHLE